MDAWGNRQESGTFISSFGSALLATLGKANHADAISQPQAEALDGCPSIALAYMGRIRILPMLSLHVQRFSALPTRRIDPSRWLYPDPYNGSYNLADPQSLNRYSYVTGRPLASVDPTGLFQFFPVARSS